MKLDKDQTKILNSSENNICVIAGAGSGKTTVLTEKVLKTVEQADKSESIVCITFTNLAAQEMKSRLGDRIQDRDNIFVGTIHSLANKLLRRLTDEDYQLLTEVEELKIARFLNKIHKLGITEDDFEIYKKNRKLVLAGKWMSHEVYKGISKTSTDVLTRLFSEEHSDECNVYNYASKKGYITFKDLLVMCKENLEGKELFVDYMFVDEFQDIGVYEKAFIFGLEPKHMFVVGDDYQCQPEGTKITMYDGSVKSIEDLQVGDRLMTYDRKHSRFRKLSNRTGIDKAKTVTEIQTHESELLDVYSNNFCVTSYTPNHRCYVKLKKEGNENKYVIYMEENEKEYFKIGISKLLVKMEYTKPQLFAARRMISDKANKLWILDCLDTTKGATNLLVALSCNYSIPTMSWDVQVNSESDLDEMYSKLNIENMRSRAKDLLRSFNRYYEYPLKDDDTEKFSENCISTIRACNIIPNLFTLVKVNLDRTIENIDISKIELSSEKHKVYSLNVEDDHNYIGDSFLTGNSIYSFAGGTPEFLRELAENDKFSTYLLKNNYRSNPKIVKYSNDLISTQEDVIPKKCVSKSNSKLGSIVAKDGTVEDILKLLSSTQNLKDWFILCRSNNDAVYIQRRLYHENIPYETFKKGSFKDNKEMQAMLNRNSVKVLTIHAAKGLESKNVILYGNFPTEVSDIKNSFDLHTMDPEEARIFYVAVTRAKENLLIINRPPIKSYRNKEIN